ncbi:MAG: glycoside hydrolase family 140 protein [Bacteroidota bacterium]
MRISANGRYLETENNDPFFWLGDTGWLLFSKLDREEAEFYLDDRAGKGFNVIQVMLLHSTDVTNAYGDSALHCRNIGKPRCTAGNAPDDPEAYDYWDHVDFILDLAAERGIYLALVPVWGSEIRQGRANLEEAGAYALWLAERFGNRSNIIWLNGGDTRGDQNTEIWNLIGTQLHQKTGQLISFHPFGRTCSSRWFHDKEWLDFNMCQSGHRRYDQDDSETGYGEDNWRYIRDARALSPVKPVLDGEPSYESIPQGLHDPNQPYWKAADVRRYAYWSVFSGGCGFTYGHNAVMQFHKPGDTDPAYGVREYWTDALNAEGACQMQYLKALMNSEPYSSLYPDQSLLAGPPGEKYDYQPVIRGEDYAFVYSSNGREITLKMGKIKGSRITATWFNPRNGEKGQPEVFKNCGTRTFNPPGEDGPGKDWVLILKSTKQKER